MAERAGAGTPRLLRAINDRAALRTLLERGPLTRPELGALIGLSKPTISQVLSRLRRTGLVVQDGIREGGPGRTAEVYRLDGSAGHSAALDVTPARILAAVADLTGTVVGEHVVRTPGRSGGDVVERVRSAVHGAAAAADVDPARIRRVVIGTPGAINPATGRLGYAPHLPGWHGPRLLERLSDGLGTIVTLENDVNLAAIAERATGAARDAGDFVLLYVSDGIGLAIMLGGTLHRGATGGAGEVGYMPVAGGPVIRDVARLNQGGLQSMAGGPAVLKILRAVGLRGRTPATALRSAAAAAEAADGSGAVAERAGAALDEIARRLAVGLAAVTSVLDPELIVLTGDVPLAGGETLRRRVERELYPMTVPRPRVALSAVTGDPILAGALELATAATARELFADTVPGLRTPDT